MSAAAEPAWHFGGTRQMSPGLAWHFVGRTLRDGRPVPSDGETLRHTGPLVMCQSGLHFSRRLRDALRYAPGSTVCCVYVGGEIIEEPDKGDCTERTIIWRADATETLREYARLCALDVVHMWDAPEVAMEYLRTGDQTKWVAARAAANRAARDTSKASGRAAARAAACAAVDSSTFAARETPWAAVDSSTLAAREAAWAAIDAVSGDDVGIAAQADAWDAAVRVQSDRLTKMVMKLAPEWYSE